MNILFVIKHTGYVRNFESTLRLLAERGHCVHVAFSTRPRSWLHGRGSAIVQLSVEYSNISHGAAPRTDYRWRKLEHQLRRASDYLRYQQPCYRHAPKLRARVERHAPAFAQRVAAWPLLGTPRGLRIVQQGIAALEEAIPNDAQIAAFIRARQPDILLVTPLVGLGFSQDIYVRVARALRIPTGVCVASWDNLTNKGLIGEIPDLVAVWNEVLKREAVELHGVPEGQVVVTGAVAYDHWFAWKSTTSRAEFLNRVGLPADRPFVLYLCSSAFVAPAEVSFVKGWVQRIRAADDPRAREAGVLIRPHPQNTAQWRDVDLTGLGAATIWPRAGADPIDAESKREYYDSIYHSAAVVGVNTSALIESAIVGRPVYTVLAPEFRETQEGTLHFHHLVGAKGGLLRVARSTDEHVVQLSEALGAEGLADDGRNRQFLEMFVRPHGLGVPATPRLVAAIEGTATGPVPATRPRPLVVAVLRALLSLLAPTLHRGASRWRPARQWARLRRSTDRWVQQRVKRIRRVAGRWVMQWVKRIRRAAISTRRLRRRWTTAGRTLRGSVARTLHRARRTIGKRGPRTYRRMRRTIRKRCMTVLTRMVGRVRLSVDTASWQRPKAPRLLNAEDAGACRDGEDRPEPPKASGRDPLRGNGLSGLAGPGSATRARSDRGQGAD